MAVLTRRRPSNKRINVLERRLGTAELAKRFTVTASTVRRWLRGNLPEARKERLNAIWAGHQRGRKASKSRKRHQRGHVNTPKEPPKSDEQITFTRERQLIRDSVVTYDRIKEALKVLQTTPALMKDAKFLKQLERDIQARSAIREKLDGLADMRIRKMLTSEKDLEAHAKILARQHLLPERYFYVLFFSP